MIAATPGTPLRNRQAIRLRCTTKGGLGPDGIEGSDTHHVDVLGRLAIGLTVRVVTTSGIPGARRSP